MPFVSLTDLADNDSNTASTELLLRDRTGAAQKWTVPASVNVDDIGELACDLQMLNPDVATRPKGVVEKCTFCIQRINAGKDQAEAEGRPLKDGEIKPACVQSCPTSAIVFGDLNDTESEVSRLSRSSRGTKLLEDLGTHPKVTYLQRGY